MRRRGTVRARGKSDFVRSAVREGEGGGEKDESAVLAGAEDAPREERDLNCQQLNNSNMNSQSHY